jgi:hypothetical protein
MKNEKSLMVMQDEQARISDPAIVAAAETAKARIQAAYTMAYRKPRDFDESRARILEACKRPEFAERVEYSKPVGGKSIIGPSIRFAETAIRLWENILTESQVIYEDDYIRRIKISCLDLETNVQHSKDIQIRKTIERKSKKGRDEADILGERLNSKGETVYIVKATDDELQNKEAALISKAIRNEGLRLLPTDIIDEAIKIARQTLANKDASDPNAAKKRIIDSFSSINIYPKDLVGYLNHSLDTISPAELNELRGIYAAISSGEATWNAYIVTKKELEFDMLLQDNTEEIEKEKIFDDLIKNHTGKLPAQWGSEFEEFINRVAENQEPPLTTEQFKANINKDNVADFWKGYGDYARQNKEIPDGFLGTVYIDDTSISNPMEYDTGKEPENSSQSQKIISPNEEKPKVIEDAEPNKNDNLQNPFENINWADDKSNKGKLKAFFLDNLAHWENTSAQKQRIFALRWLHVFPETDKNGRLKQPFPLPVKEIEKEVITKSNEEDTKPGDEKELDYAKLLQEYMDTLPEKYLMACENCGYSTMIVPTGRKAQEELYNMYNTL